VNCGDGGGVIEAWACHAGSWEAPCHIGTEENQEKWKMRTWKQASNLRSVYSKI